MQGRLAPGARLVEAELALSCGVSRVPLREAFRILATEGLVDLSLHRGATVRPLSETELQELFGVRMAIESFAAATLARRGDSAALARLRKLVRDMRASISAGDTGAYHQLAASFHECFVEAAGNALLTATYGRDGLESSERWARPHISSGGRWIPVRPKETYYRVPPAAGVNASITDVALWLVAQMGDRPDVLPQELLDDVQAPQINTPGELRGSGWRRDRLRSASYASGWRVYDYAGERLVFHGGAVQGYRAVAGFLPEQGIGVAILWNSESAVPTGLMPSILDRALGLPERDWVQLDRLRRPGRRR